MNILDRIKMLMKKEQVLQRSSIVDSKTGKPITDEQFDTFIENMRQYKPGRVAGNSRCYPMFYHKP